GGSVAAEGRGCTRARRGGRLLAFSPETGHEECLWPVPPLRVGYRPTAAFSASRMAIRFGLAASLLGSRSSSTPSLRLAWIFSASTLARSQEVRAEPS